MVLQDESCTFYPRIVHTLDLPHGKGIRGCVCTKLHHKVYVIGGHDEGYSYLKDVYSFDTATRQWEKEASMNTARYLPSVTLTRGGTSIMVCGGINMTGKCLDTCEEYNDRSKDWTVLPYRLNPPRYKHFSICSGSRVVVAAGYNSSLLCLVETEVIDLDSSIPQWTFGPPLEEKRHGCAACIVGDYIVVAGGSQAGKQLSSCEAIVTRDIDSRGGGKWRVLRGLDMNKRRWFFGMVLVGSHLMALSGGGSGEKTCETLDVSSLLTLQRANTRPTEPSFGFFGDGGWSTLEHKLEELATTSCNVLETKVFYTYTKQCIRLGLIDRMAAGRVIKAGLQTGAKMCGSEDTFLMYMMILEKARADLFVTQQDIHQLLKSQAGHQRAQDVPLAKNVVDETSPTETHCVGDYVKGLSTHALELLDYAEHVRTNCKMQRMLFKHAPMDILQENGSFPRTALDVTALTGQPEMVDMMMLHGGKFHFGGLCRMKRMKRLRSLKHEEYMNYIDSTL